MPATAQTADLSHFGRVSDYIRDRSAQEVSLGDVVALAEITAESFQAFFASMDQAVYKELRQIADYIAQMRSEIGALQPNDLRVNRIPSAGRELDLIVQSTADATNAIMAAAEDIMSADSADIASYKALVDDRMLTIFEACSFQDITGQRVRKVVATLEQIEKRVSRFAEAVNATDVAGFADEAERARAERDKALILHGPASDQNKVEQADIDALFDVGGEAQDAIDALFS